MRDVDGNRLFLGLALFIGISFGALFYCVFIHGIDPPPNEVLTSFQFFSRPFIEFARTTFTNVGGYIGMAVGAAFGVFMFLNPKY